MTSREVSKVLGITVSPIIKRNSFYLGDIAFVNTMLGNKDLKASEIKGYEFRKKLLDENDTISRQARSDLQVDSTHLEITFPDITTFEFVRRGYGYRLPKSLEDIDGIQIDFYKGKTYRMRFMYTKKSYFDPSGPRRINTISKSFDLPEELWRHTVPDHYGVLCSGFSIDASSADFAHEIVLEITIPSMNATIQDQIVEGLEKQYESLKKKNDRFRP